MKFLKKTDEEILSTFELVRNYFSTINKIKQDDNYRLRTKIVPNYIVDELVQKCNIYELHKNEICDGMKHNLSFKIVAKTICKMLKLKRFMSRKDRKIIKKSDKFRTLLKEREKESLELAPKVDGRIKCINQATV